MTYPTERNIEILLITNNDSDNVGDQVIEACDISLIKTAAKNLSISEDNLAIESIALGIIPNSYCESNNPKLLEAAELRIKNATLVLFGGAPVFNYKYKNFYKKTAAILDLAKRHNKPVMFSAIGINDGFDAENEKCQTLKSALMNGAVKQATSRDGFGHLEKYARIGSFSSEDSVDRFAFPIQLVSDPAVYTNAVFKNFSNQIKNQNTNTKIGLFVFRPGGFQDNGIHFSRIQQCIFWKDVCKKLEELGYDYELLTSGHFADEANLQYLIDNKYVSEKKCIKNINTPEDLINRIQSYSGIITCRLHPSIISFSYGIPCISLVWNSKVTDFYSQIGYPDRAIPIDKLLFNDCVSVSPVIDQLESALQNGVQKDSSYIESNYITLLHGIASCLEIKQETYQPYCGKHITNNLIPYTGTTEKMKKEKIERKYTRCYRGYTDARMHEAVLKSSKKVIHRLLYHSGSPNVEISIHNFNGGSGIVDSLSSGNFEYRFAENIPNVGSNKFAPCGFIHKAKQFKGWKVRVKIENKWFWLVGHGGLIPKNEYSSSHATLFQPNETIPILPVNRIECMVAEAVWNKKITRVINSRLFKNS